MACRRQVHTGPSHSMGLDLRGQALEGGPRVYPTVPLSMSLPPPPAGLAVRCSPASSLRLCANQLLAAAGLHGVERVRQIGVEAEGRECREDVPKETRDGSVSMTRSVGRETPMRSATLVAVSP